MQARSPEQALRRAIVELASAKAEDVEAVLSQLEPAHQKRARQLLKSYIGVGYPAEAASVETVVGVADALGLSAWMIDRARPSSALTPQAAEALRACMVEAHGRRGSLRLGAEPTALDGLARLFRVRVSRGEPA